MVSSFQFPVPLEDSHREIAPLATKRQDHVQLGEVLVTALFGGAIPGR